MPKLWKLTAVVCSALVASLPLDGCVGNGNASAGREGALVSQLQSAATKVGRGQIIAAINKLDSILDRFDDEPAPTDWPVKESGEEWEKSYIAGDVELRLFILLYLM